MSLADILAKKKAAAAAASAPTQAPAPAPAPVAEAPAQPAKPLTFAEKMALKKAQAAGTLTAALAKPAPVAEASPLAVLDEPAVSAPVQQKVPKEIPILTEDTNTQQQYAGIRAKIDDLESRMGSDLKVAMEELKIALRSNPEACELMLDEDIGEMVKALRRMTMQDVIETKEPGKKKPKATTMAALTTAMLEEGLKDF